MMTSLSRYKQGSIWIAKMHFLEKEESKNRPVMLACKEKAIDKLSVIIFPITTHDSRNQFDHQLEYWKEANLKKPSVVRVSKVDHLSKWDLIRKIGYTHEDDLTKIIEQAKDLF